MDFIRKTLTVPAAILINIVLLNLTFVSSVLALEKINVGVSVLPQAYFVERIGGQRVCAQVLLPPSANHEIYEPTPRQLREMSNVKIYFKLGDAALFPFEERCLDFLSSKKDKVKIVNMSEGLTKDREDPHVWLSVSVVKGAAENICQALGATDPVNKEYYRKNLDVFLNDIQKLENHIRKTLAGKEGCYFMVFHPAWGYFARNYGLNQLAIEEEGKPVNAFHIKKMIDVAKKKGIKVIFVQKGFDSKSAGAIARQIGGKLQEVDPLDKDWLNNMKRFADLLSPALRR
jgi:zinc transport system substrate-binding protein